MARASKYKYEKGDVIGLYKVLKVLPNKPLVKNLVIYCECLLCGDKVERWSNRLDSKHRGCKSEAKVDKSAEPVAEPIVVTPVAHKRADGKIVQTNENGNVVAELPPAPTVAIADDDAEELELGDLNLPAEVMNALNFDVDAQAVELVKQSEGLDTGSKFLFMTTLRRYLTLVHLARKIERKLARMDELTTLGSNGNQVSNPLIAQYKAISSESNVTVRVLTNVIAKFNSGDDDEDELAKALRGE